jgi:uncharacterized integral membrane protein (TIGR00698 family)
MTTDRVIRILFLAVATIVLLPTAWMSPPLALLLGVLFGLVFVHPYPAPSRKTARLLLQISIVGLGFAMNLDEVLRAGRSGFVYTLMGIAFALAVGWVLGRILGVSWKSSYLISTGTAICGGSAIAAVGPVIDASDEEMSVSIGTVFLLNAAGLLLFPPLGKMLGLSEPEFGLWAALAIHDTSSVVGAGAKYGALALAVATTVKLARALWIVPLTLATASVRGRKAPMRSIQWPWFILFFLLAAVVSTYLPAGADAYSVLAKLGRAGLTLTLFLIGTGITRASLQRVGAGPLAQGILLWIMVAMVSLVLIRQGWIAI